MKLGNTMCTATFQSCIQYCDLWFGCTGTVSDPEMLKLCKRNCVTKYYDI